MAKKPKLVKKKEVEEVKSQKGLNAVDFIERIPSDKVDLEKLGAFCQAQLDGIISDKAVYTRRREQFINSVDNFVDYDFGNLPFDGASNLHVPVIMEKSRATHARLYQAMFNINPPFFVEPQEPLDAQRVKSITQLMKWAVSRYCNYYKGIYEAFDDGIWNFTTEGWCFFRQHWVDKYRKALTVEQKVEPPQKQKAIASLSPDQAIPPIKLVEEEKWVPVFSGPVVENILQENVFMPGYGDPQSVPLVAIYSKLTTHDLKVQALRGFFDKRQVELALEEPNAKEKPRQNQNLTALKGRNQGVVVDGARAEPLSPDLKPTEHDVYECFATFDINGDGFDEELVVHYHYNSGVVLRWTYLDRITKTGRRPIYTAGYIRRPGRNYHIGLCELLYSLGREVDIIHNQRVDYGTLTNLPFFFYGNTSALQNDEIKLKPGVGIPCGTVNEIFFPTLKTGTQWGFQEENLLFQIINRVSSISDINVGQPSSSEMLRTQGGVSALLTEGNAPLDIALRRLQACYGDILSDMHQMLVEKLPQSFQHLIVGSNGKPMLGKDGMPIMQKIESARKEVSGRVHFNITANTNVGNKAMMRQQRTVLFQQLLNPAGLQMGIVQPHNVYEMYKALLEVSDELDIDRYITEPENAPKPLSLAEEIEHLQQGLMPEIPYNDDHKTKIQMLNMWINSPQVQEGLKIGNVSPMAPTMTFMAVNDHAQKAQMVQQQMSGLQNATGSQISQALMQNTGQFGPQGTGALQPPPATAATAGGEGGPPQQNQV